MSPRYSIIIPAYNEAFELPQTLAAFRVAAGRYHEAGGIGGLEFIVVDNASTDCTAEIAREWGATVVNEPRRQIARVRNRGARAATGEILITCDADSRPHPAIFTRIERRLDDRTFALGCGFWSSEMRWWYLPAFFGVNLISVLCRLPAGMFILRRADFVALGGFDERLYALEDVDLARRIRAAARLRRQRIRILLRAPIDTSTRKFRLIRWSSFLAFLIRFLLHPRKYTTRRACWDAYYYGAHLREN